MATGGGPSAAAGGGAAARPPPRPPARVRADRGNLCRDSCFHEKISASEGGWLDAALLARRESDLQEAHAALADQRALAQRANPEASAASITLSISATGSCSSS